MPEPAGRSGRRARVVAAAAAAALLVLAGLLLVSFDASSLGRAILERGGAAVGMRLTARSFRLRALSGLTLEGVEGSASFAGGRAVVSIDRLVLDHRLWRLLRGEIAVDRLVLHRPRIQLAESASAHVPASAGAAAGAATAQGLGRMVLRISRIDVEDGTIELQAAGAPAPLVVKGLDLRLRDVAMTPSPGAAMAGLAAVGDLRVAEVALAHTKATDLSGSLRLSQGRLQTDTVRFRTDEGRFQATLGAELARLPLRYTLSLQGDPLDVARLMGAGPGSGFGAASLKVAAQGIGTAPDGVQGTGTLSLEAGTLGATPVLKAVEQALGRAGVVGARYQATEMPFRIEGERVVFDRLVLQTDHVGLQVAGWASLQGPLDLSVSVRVPRQGLAVAGMGGEALDLITDQAGRAVVPFKVTGTQAHPRVLPDAAALAAQAKQGVARSLLDKAGRGLGGLLSKKPREDR